MQKSILEELGVNRIQNFKSRERLQKTINCLEGRITKELGQETQHCCNEKQTEIKILPLIQKYVNDKDASFEAIQYELVNEDLTNVNNNHVIECEPEDRVVNFVISSNQNKMEKETVKVNENKIEESRMKMEKENQIFMDERVR